MVGYEKEFNRLSKYALKPFLTKTFLCRQFEDGLKESIKRYLTAVTLFQMWEHRPPYSEVSTRI